MVWSYSGDPGSSEKDAVRFYVQDVITKDPQVNDEEIEYLLNSENDDVLRAAARTAEVIAAMYARQVDKSVGGLSLSAGRRQEHYEKLASQLWARSRSGTGSATNGGGLPVPYAGGVSRQDKLTKETDTDRTKPFFTRDLQDFERSLPTVGGGNPDTV